MREIKTETIKRIIEEVSSLGFEHSNTIMSMYDKSGNISLYMTINTAGDHYKVRLGTRKEALAPDSPTHYGEAGSIKIEFDGKTIDDVLTEVKKFIDNMEEDEDIRRVLRTKKVSKLRNK